MKKSLNLGKGASPFDAIPNLLIAHEIKSNTPTGWSPRHHFVAHNTEEFEVDLIVESNLARQDHNLRYDGCSSGEISKTGLRWFIPCPNLLSGEYRRESGFFTRTPNVRPVTIITMCAQRPHSSMVHTVIQTITSTGQ